MSKIDGKWKTEAPEDLSKWLWKHDGGEAVVVDDATQSYYCARPEAAAKYREAWKKESKPGDKRTAAMFIDLDKKLFATS